MDNSSRGSTQLVLNCVEDFNNAGVWGLRLEMAPSGLMSSSPTKICKQSVKDGNIKKDLVTETTLHFSSF